MSANYRYNYQSLWLSTVKVNLLNVYYASDQQRLKSNRWMNGMTDLDVAILVIRGLHMQRKDFARYIQSLNT